MRAGQEVTEGHEKKRLGRFTKFTPELGQVIIAEVRASKSISFAAMRAGVTSKTAYNWLNKGEQAVDGPLKQFATGLRRPRLRG